MSDKDKYKHYTKNNNDIPIYSSPWWLDAVCEIGSWNVIIFEKNNNLIAALPYFVKKKGFFDLNILPKFTPRLGPIFFEKDNINQTEILNYFEKKLPNCNYFDQTWDFNINNWLPFYWKGYSQTTCYTIVIENIQNYEKTIKKFKQNRRQDINKAKNFITKTNFNISPEIFFLEHKKNLKKKNKNISYGFNLFKKIHDACKNNLQGTIAGCVDEKGKYHSMAFIVWDKDYAYLNQLTTDPDKIKIGSSSLLIKDILDFLKDKTKHFDFEGSMDIGIYKFYRSFGGKIKKMNKIKKTNPKILNSIIEATNLGKLHKKKYG